MKRILFAVLPIFLMSACVSTKKFKALDTEYVSLKDIHEKTLADLARTQQELLSCRAESKKLSQDLDHLRKMNDQLMGNLHEMATLTRKEAENLEKSLEKIKEKDLQIKTLNQAVNKKDSMTIALVTSLKGAIGNLDDQDIQINVEKGVIFVTISDRFLFRSGSYEISIKAKEVLGKVAKIIESKPELEVLVEGHTDNVSFRRGELLDNWDLSAKRATALVRTLQKQYNIAPERMTAAGRGEYVPIAPNTDAAGKAANRRTRIIIMPKLDQFYGMIEEELNKSK